MVDLPAMLKLSGKRAVVVGGGKVAARRAVSLREAGADVIVIAPEVIDDVRRSGAVIEQREYRSGDLAEAHVVIVATDDTTTNERISREARAAGVWVNRADDPESGDFVVPAHCEIGPITLAVTTGGISARAAAVIRDQLMAALDKDWVTLLEAVHPLRAEIQAKFDDPAKRTAALHKLTDPQAMAVLKDGGVDALRDHCRKMIQQLESTT